MPLAAQGAAGVCRYLLQTLEELLHFRPAIGQPPELPAASLLVPTPLLEQFLVSEIFHSGTYNRIEHSGIESIQLPTLLPVELDIVSCPRILFLRRVGWELELVDLLARDCGVPVQVL